MLHIDLFSGIGGFAYAADQVFGGGITHVFCDNEPFARQVLKKHWPESEIYDDIRSITADTFHSGRVYGQSQEQPTASSHETQRQSQPGIRPPAVYLLTGGFPCQPFSQAGKRRGATDDRFLWPEMLRVIRLTRPEWVIAENVNGILTLDGGVVFEQVCLDLEAAGYEVQPFVIPAAAVNAPHRRDRVWFIAHRPSPGPQRLDFGKSTRNTRVGERYPGHDAEGVFSIRSRGRDEGSGQILERQESEVQDAGPDWESHWLQIAAEFCSVDDGLPVELDGFKLSKAQHRASQIKGYGNAIVPQVAVEIMKAIKATNQEI